MKRFLIYILIYLMTVNPVFAANLWVAQTGSGSADGSSYANRAALSTHNAGTDAFADLDNDIVILTGEFTDAIRPPDSGSAGNVITYDGDASSYDGSAVDGHSSDYSVTYSSSFYLYGDDYITIQNFTIDWDYTEVLGDTATNIFGMYIRDSDNITIDNVTVTQVNNGVYFYGGCNDILVTNNTFTDIAEAGLWFSSDGSNPPYNITVGGSEGNGNTFNDITHKLVYGNNSSAYSTRLTTDVHDVVVSYNTYSYPTEYYGMCSILAYHNYDILIERNKIQGGRAYNTRPAIDIKGGSTAPTTLSYQIGRNIIVRHNEIYDLDQSPHVYAGTYYSVGVKVSGNWHDVYIYGNNIRDGAFGMDLNTGKWDSPATDSDDYDPANGVVWGNVVTGMQGPGILFAEVTATDTMSYMAAVYNTVYDCTKDTSANAYESGISLYLDTASAGTSLIANNIVESVRQNVSGNYNFYAPDDSDIDETGNNFHDYTAVYWSGSSCTPCEYDSGSLPVGQGDGDTGNAPAFVNPAGNDFRLTGESPCRSAGQVVNNTGYMPTSGSPIDIQGVTYCDSGCDDDTLDFAYGLGTDTVFTPGSFSADWIARINRDQGAAVYEAGSGSGGTNNVFNHTEDAVLNHTAGAIVN